MTEVKTISIIVPIYKGNHYISDLFHMVQENWRLANEIFPTKIELILVNDFPEERLEIGNCIPKDILCVVLTNEKNSGIHFSRVQGFLASKGKYILFLDQDDQISSIYIREQLIGLGEGDAIVCNGKNRGDLIYRNITELNRVKDIDEYKKGYNYIVSPGQVLIRRDSIPQEWLENTLHNNGADDYFLWLLILLKKNNILVQDKKLYWHVISDENTSSDICTMDCSVFEMAQKMVHLGYLNCKEEEQIRQGRIRVYKTGNIAAEEYQKEKAYKEALDLWLELRYRKISLDRFLKKKSFYNVTIYGGGMLGKHLYCELQTSDIKVNCFLDRDSKAGVGNVPTIIPGEKIEGTDVIIVTPFMEYKQIREELKKYYLCNIISIQTVLLNADCELEE